MLEGAVDPREGGACDGELTTHPQVVVGVRLGGGGV